MPYDIYSPRTTNVDNIVQTVAFKSSQAKGVILNLRQTKITIDNFDFGGDVLLIVHRDYPTQNVQDVIVVP